LCTKLFVISIEVKDFGKEKEKEKIRDKLMEKKGLEKMKVRFFN